MNQELYEEVIRNLEKNIQVTSGIIYPGESKNLKIAEEVFSSKGYSTEKVTDQKLGEGIKFNKLEAEARKWKHNSDVEKHIKQIMEKE